jgi:hypothetical protein
VQSGGGVLAGRVDNRSERLVVHLNEALDLPTGGELRLEAHA